MLDVMLKDFVQESFKEFEGHSIYVTSVKEISISECLKSKRRFVLVLTIFLQLK